MRIALLIAFLTSMAFGEVHERKVSVHGREWQVVYDVPMCNPPKENGNCTVSVTATYPPGQTHYDATITIFEIGSKPIDGHATTFTEKIQIGESFAGAWTQEGCFEDDPEMLVEKVLGHHHNGATISNVPHMARVNSVGNVTGQTGIASLGIFQQKNCQDGTVDFNPVYDGEDVILVARICQGGQWKQTQVKIGLVK